MAVKSSGTISFTDLSNEFGSSNRRADFNFLFWEWQNVFAGAQVGWNGQATPLSDYYLEGGTYQRVPATPHNRARVPRRGSSLYMSQFYNTANEPQQIFTMPEIASTNFPYDVSSYMEANGLVTSGQDYARNTEYAADKLSLARNVYSRSIKVDTSAFQVDIGCYRGAYWMENPGITVVLRDGPGRTYAFERVQGSGRSSIGATSLTRISVPARTIYFLLPVFTDGVTRGDMLIQVYYHVTIYSEGSSGGNQNARWTTNALLYYDSVTRPQISISSTKTNNALAGIAAQASTVTVDTSAARAVEESSGGKK